MAEAVVYVPLAGGAVALLDFDDINLVRNKRWSAHADRPGVVYAQRNEYFKRDGKWRARSTSMHRLVMNPGERMQVDHKNHDTLDNRRSNLRVCTKSQNLMNMVPTGKTSRFKGVSWSKSHKSWCVHLTKNGIRVFFKRFKDEEEAARTYDSVAREHFGEFAYTNFKGEK